MYSSSLYLKAPVWGQEALIAARSWMRMQMREGRAFERLLREVEATQWYSNTELERYRHEQIAGMLQHAVTQCRFYERFSTVVAASGADATTTLSELPLIDKSLVREAGLALLARDARRPLVAGSTSGTTGAPLKLSQDLYAINRENAFIWRQLQWAGLEKGGRRAWIRGDMVAPMSQQVPPFWRINKAERMLMLSSYHLAEKNAGAYIAALAAFEPQVIQAYPSSIAFLATWLDANGKDYPSDALRGIVTSSETLDADIRALIERRFGCRVFDWYGQFERVAAIGTCEQGSYHLLSDYSNVEFLPADDGLVEVVGSGFNNRAMPLIRYRTGDFVELADAAERCDCGRHFPLVRRIQGRADDVVKLADGRRIGRLDHIFKGVKGVIEAQIRQEALECIEILIVSGADYGQQTERVLMANARERLGDGVQIKIATVDAIPRTKNGKFRGVVCNV